MAKTDHEAQMIGRMFPPHQLAVRSLSDTMVRSVSTSLWDSFEQKESQPSVTRYRHSRHVQCISLPQYVTGISSRSRYSAFHHKPPAETYNARHSVVFSTPHGWIPAQAIRSSTVATTKTSSRRNQHVHSTKKQPSQTRQPNLLQQAIKAASRVRHPAFLNTPPEKTFGVRYPTFPNKLPQASSTSYPVFLDTSSYLQWY